MVDITIYSTLSISTVQSRYISTESTLLSTGDSVAIYSYLLISTLWSPMISTYLLPLLRGVESRDGRYCGEKLMPTLRLSNGL